MSWIVGALIALGTFNHAIVSTIELIFGMRYGGDVGYGQLFGNLGVAVGGNFVGGLLLVTFARTTALSSTGSRPFSSTADGSSSAISGPVASPR